MGRASPPALDASEGERYQSGVTERIHSWKSLTANRLQRDNDRRGRVWQDEYFDRIVRDEKEFAQKFDYIQGNPWTRVAAARDIQLGVAGGYLSGGQGRPPHWIGLLN